MVYTSQLKVSKELEAVKPTSRFPSDETRGTTQNVDDKVTKNVMFYDLHDAFFIAVLC